jgi:hypothetical protein
MILSLAAASSLVFTPLPVRGAEPRQAPPVAIAADEKLVRIPGTRVRMAVPAGHEHGQGFHGYQWPRTSSSIMVMEMPAPYAEATSGFNAEELARRGMQLIELSTARICGRDGKLLLIAQEAQGIEFKKWIAVCGDADRTLMLHATFPELFERQVSAPLKAALLGARWDPTLELDPLEALDWTLAAPEGLRFALEMGGMLLFTETGEDVQKDGRLALLTAGTSMGQPGAIIPRFTTERRARELPYDAATFAIVSSTQFEHASRAGWEVVARATDDEGVELVVLVVMLFEGGRYALVHGQAPLAAQDVWLPRLRASARSWKEKPAPEPPEETPEKTPEEPPEEPR